METKFTKDGKKVAVIGKLNNEQWIVQEIFVEGGKEFPAGENFTAKTLLDKPADTWEKRELTKLSDRKGKLEREIEKLEKKSTIVRKKSRICEVINFNTEKYKDIDIEQLEIVLDFMSGNITHVAISRYSEYKIVELADLLADTDRYDINGLKLLSLFGCHKRGERYIGGKDDFSCDLGWSISHYRDGSGGARQIYPCRSYEEAVAKLNDLIALEDKATCYNIKSKEEYELSYPTEEAIKVFRVATLESAEKKLKSKEDEVSKAKSEIEDIKALLTPNPIA